MGEREWRGVLAQEALTWCVGKTVASASGGEFDMEYTTYFTDGSALSVRYERGHVYSEWTEDSDEVHFMVSEPAR